MSPRSAVHPALRMCGCSFQCNRQGHTGTQVTEQCEGLLSPCMCTSWVCLYRVTKWLLHCPVQAGLSLSPRTPCLLRPCALLPDRGLLTPCASFLRDSGLSARCVGQGFHLKSPTRSCHGLTSIQSQTLHPECLAAGAPGEMVMASTAVPWVTVYPHATAHEDRNGMK